MGLGDNSRASLITRGLAETGRLGVALGADPLTFAGLAGLGDLVATCSSPLSRNRTFGEHLGRGETLEQAEAATTARPPRASSPACRSASWRARTASRCRSPSGAAGLPRGARPVACRVRQGADQPGAPSRSRQAVAAMSARPRPGGERRTSVAMA